MNMADSVCHIHILIKIIYKSMNKTELLKSKIAEAQLGG
ncbi:MAG: hypothetical protein RI955_230, partial [Bacteroidota bacterium]